MKYFFRRVVFLFSGFFVSNFFVYKLIGFINKKFLKERIESVFLFYPANKSYIKPYSFDWYAEKIKWTPKLVGFYTQKGKAGFIFGISASDEDFFDKNNINDLKKLDQNFEKIQKSVGGKQRVYAGVIPGVMERSGILKNPTSSLNTAYAVVMAVKKIIFEKKKSNESPIVVIGALGHVGSIVIEELKKDFKKVYSADLKAGNANPSKWPDEFRAGGTIIVNITKKGALKEYADELWEGAIFVNEVYPEPSEEELAKLQAKGVEYFHIAGIKGSAWPSFPKSYEGAIPCCATINSSFKFFDFNDIILKSSKIKNK